MGKQEIIELLDEFPKYKNKIFERGYFATNDLSIDDMAYPFYGNWNKFELNGVLFLISPEQTAYFNDEYVLIGNAYNPFTMQASEPEILDTMTLESFNQLTGVFVLFKIEERRIVAVGDPVGLYSTFYTTEEDRFYFSSHVNLLGDILGLSQSQLMKELKKYKLFHYFGNQLPGNITPFENVKRLIPNHKIIVTGEVVSVERFYLPKYQDKDMSSLVDEISGLLQKNMQLICQKWERPAISLTGGCDSKTTLACATGLYNYYRYFSYDSQVNEKPDADAAKMICEALGLEHIYYHIPYDDQNIDEIEVVRAVIAHNCGEVVPNNRNDVRKRAYLSVITDFDVEVKSWASEVGRARYTKKYNGRKHFGKFPKPRQCSTFYKILLFNPKLQRKVDKIFKDYIDAYFKSSEERPVPWQDQFYWEWHWPSRDGVMLTGEHMYSSNITVPYNNRLLLELLLSVPEEDRVKDTAYSLVRRLMNPKIDEATRLIVDVNHTKKRAIAEEIYYYVNRLLP